MYWLRYFYITNIDNYLSFGGKIAYKRDLDSSISASKILTNNKSAHLTFTSSSNPYKHNIKLIFENKSCIIVEKTNTITTVKYSDQNNKYIRYMDKKKDPSIHWIKMGYLANGCHTRVYYMLYKGSYSIYRIDLDYGHRFIGLEYGEDPDSIIWMAIFNGDICKSYKIIPDCNWVCTKDEILPSCYSIDLVLRGYDD